MLRHDSHVSRASWRACRAVLFDKRDTTRHDLFLRQNTWDRQMHFRYRVTFTGDIRCFYATTSHDLVTFDLLTLRVYHVQCFSCPNHIPIYIILRISVTELRVLNIWSHFRYLKQSLRMRRVTWPLTGGKIVHIFKYLNPICLFTLSLSGRYNED